MQKRVFFNLFKRIVPNTAKRTFWLSFWLCLLGCLFILFVIAPLTGVSRHFGKAHDGYLQLARSLRDGDGYVFEKDGPSVFHRPPLYPFLLVPITFLPESLQRPVLIFIQSIMVACISGLIFKTAKRLFNPSTAGRAVVIFLLNPWVYWNAKNPMTTILQGFLYTLLIVLIGRQLLAIFGEQDNQSKKVNLCYDHFGLGIVAGALALTHGAMFAVNGVLFFLLFIVGVAKRNRQLIKTSIIAVIIMAALIAPWTYRNWAVFDRFIPVTGGGGLAYFNGNVHWAGIIEEPQRKDESYIDASLRVVGIEGTEATHTHWKGLKDIELEDTVNRKMVEHLRGHPGAFAKKLVLNAVEYYFPLLTYPYLAVKSASLENFAITVFHLILWFLAIIGSWRCRRQRNVLFSIALIFGVIVLHAVWFFPFATFIGHSLYTFGTIPFLSILAAGRLAPRHQLESC